MQLIAGRTAQEYNQRKARGGAFWEDRYHATAIEADEHLHRCLVYIDLNMVRAGVVNHPRGWAHGGYCEIQSPPKRYAVIHLEGLAELCGFTDVRDFQNAHRQWVEQALENGRALRDGRWSESIAVGSLTFVETVKNDLGVKATHREVIEADGTYTLHEPPEAYVAKFTVKNDALRLENTVLWDESVDDART
jgi:putative transposase